MTDPQISIGSATLDSFEKRFESTTKAIVLIEGQVFDVAMLDINMNGKSSGDVADALAARGVPFVYSTGNSVHDTRDGFRDRPVLKKPFSEEQLTKVLSGLLTP